ncbi:MAG: glycosyltransferase [Firmicutes bacterium]|nr:glycosyltransferase [Bacillota bacterium]
MQPLLSIVIPIYNNERTLKKMVDSILIQQFDNWELLLVNDGSTDSCAQIIDDYVKLDGRIKAFHKENGGTYTGYNLGLKRACGKYIIFASADDIFDITAFETVANQAYEYDYDIIFMQHAIYHVNSEKNTIEPKLLPSNNALKSIGKKNVEESWYYFSLIRATHSPVNAYKMDIIKKYCFREDVYAADTFMNLAIADEIQSVSYNPKILYHRYMYINVSEENKNISSGKYYPYKHDMCNVLYNESKNLFSKWQQLDESCLYLIGSTRVFELYNELEMIFAFNNKNTPIENIDIITGYYNDITFEAANFSNELNNIDNRIFSTIGIIIKENQIKNNFGNPIVRMITAINNTTISVDEIKLEIANGLLDYRNPYRIGFEAYKLLSEKYTQISDYELLNYLETERTARKLLFTGNFEQSLDTVIQLFNSKISTPEQYVILALCGYHLDLTEDAKNAVETGIKLFPNYPRLEELQNVINTERNE